MAGSCRNATAAHLLAKASNGIESPIEKSPVLYYGRESRGHRWPDAIQFEPIGNCNMKFVALLFAVTAMLLSAPTELRASIYDSNVIEELNLTGAQKREMQKLIAQSRSRRNAIFREYGIDPNAKPDVSKLQRAQGKLQANAAREQAAAKKILNEEQYKHYMRIYAQLRARITKAALDQPN
jgi:hypothetical protein